MKDDLIPAADGSSTGAGYALPDFLEDMVEQRAAQPEAEDAPRSASAAGAPAADHDADACPEPGEWVLLLADDLSPQDFIRASSLLAHAAICHICAQRLRILSADISPEERVALAGLICESADARKRMATELARTPRLASRGLTSRLYLWTGAGLAAALLITVGLTAWLRIANSPERLLAESYTHARIFDLRIPGAGFAEVTPQPHLRGSSTGREPAKLLEAKARIEHQLEAAPEDEHWLELEARSDILEEKFDPAIDILDRLAASGQPSAALLLDDATAYFQRGTATGSDTDRATALDYLRRADELAPADTVILFNEALVMEDRGQIMNAAETWNRYLRFERDPRWLAEGRSRLQGLEQRLNELKTHQSGAGD
jgi:tetratricopeptide (TPR) repeat protein